MRTSHLLSRSLSALFLLCALTLGVRAQTANEQAAAPAPQPTPAVIAPQERVASVVAGRTDLYCAGYVQYAPAPVGPEIVGGEQEQEQRTYVEGDIVYINAGSDQGVRVGQEYQIVRPRGRMTSKFTTKKGYLGVFMLELGQLRVTNVKERVSVAVITNSCETILLGDLLRQPNNRVAPLERSEVVLDRFADPTGKQRGRIIMARDAREAVSRNHVVYIDLCAEDNVKAGDYLTIYRPAGTGNLVDVENEEIAIARSSGFGSEKFDGGKFSNQSQRT
ncbi:MAG TPA: hypothetical protein VJT74_06130, partial [Pyrinomonadaceae bacterium]|nr:hypothetical protein [Pyrinomonadaceae bacterium]